MLKTKIEALLFASVKPLSAKDLTAFLKKNGETVSLEEVVTALSELQTEINGREGGVVLIEAGGGYQLITAPSESELMSKFLKEDLTGELTPASLETLTVIAYRGPIAKPELEQIRGVNCSMILRNLSIRGLITVFAEDALEERYTVTVDFLKHLGLTAVRELPDYEVLHTVENAGAMNAEATPPETLTV